MLGQLARQGIRAVAIYFSDVLLWLSVAGVFEIAFVLVAGVLCILTAGFVFEGMKRSPVVLVLGSVVALTGTFLMFREVRGYFWPAAAAVSTTDTHLAPIAPTPSLDRPVTPRTLPPAALKPAPATPCAGKTELACIVSNGCEWSQSYKRCLVKLLGPPGSSPGFFATRAPPDSLCGMRLSEPTCNLSTACYWSQLTRRCERLLFGSGVLSAKPIDPMHGIGNCSKLATRSECLAMPSCKWTGTAGGCMHAPLGR